ncbi:hypothetical protein CLOM_g6380, partial [Closterium sp. NIES-68]
LLNISPRRVVLLFSAENVPHSAGDAAAGMQAAGAEARYYPLATHPLLAAALRAAAPMIVVIVLRVYMA